MIHEWVDTLSVMITESFWLAPIFALAAGILTSLTPCSISTMPLIIGYVGEMGSNDTKKAFKLSLIFSLGKTITFAALGIIASILGKLMLGAGSWWYILLGVLMTLMALQIWGIYEFIPSSFLASRATKKGYAGALIAGILGGIFSSPCATPVLIVLLSIVAKQGNVLWGILLLLLYSAGHSILTIFAGTSVGLIQKITSDKRYGTMSNILKYIMGLLILFIALYMFYLGF